MQTRAFFLLASRRCKVILKRGFIIPAYDSREQTMRVWVQPGKSRWSGRKRALQACLLALACAPGARAQRSKLKPPWNMYSPETDVQVGKQNAEILEKRLPLCNVPKVDAYLTKLGLKLVGKLPTHGVQYPWQFHCVNSKEINAFALPGGYVFVNRGAIEVSDNEAQLAAVMAHELSHVALRHGTAQASKAQIMQGAAGIFGGIFGGSTGGALLTQGVALGAGSVLLHYSRSDETQADLLGTQALYDSGYDPRAMAQFFEKLESETQGKNPPQFLSDHPNPGNRVERVNEEIDKLGGVPANAKRDSADFEAVKREVMALPVVRMPAAATASVAPAPSGTFVDYQVSAYALKVPENWKKYEDKGSVTFAPDGGISQSGSLAYGMIVSVNQAQTDASEHALDNATLALIQELVKTNPGLKVTREPGRVQLNGQPGLSTYLSNDSPAGGKETDWLITVLRPQGLVSFLCVAPQSAYPEYEKAFTVVLDSVRLLR
jgi:beta-barrel assembly-enhancing protease